MIADYTKLGKILISPFVMMVFFVFSGRSYKAVAAYSGEIF